MEINSGLHQGVLRGLLDMGNKIKWVGKTGVIG